jgi:hypothetical protein
MPELNQPIISPDLQRIAIELDSSHNVFVKNAIDFCRTDKLAGFEHSVERLLKDGHRGDYFLTLPTTIASQTQNLYEYLISHPDLNPLSDEVNNAEIFSIDKKQGTITFDIKMLYLKFKVASYENVDYKKGEKFFTVLINYFAATDIKIFDILKLSVLQEMNLFSGLFKCPSRYQLAWHRAPYASSTRITTGNSTYSVEQTYYLSYNKLNIDFDAWIRFGEDYILSKDNREYKSKAPDSLILEFTITDRQKLSAAFHYRLVSFPYNTAIWGENTNNNLPDSIHISRSGEIQFIFPNGAKAAIALKDCFLNSSVLSHFVSDCLKNMILHLEFETKNEPEEVRSKIAYVKELIDLAKSSLLLPLKEKPSALLDVSLEDFYSFAEIWENLYSKKEPQTQIPPPPPPTAHRNKHQ